MSELEYFRLVFFDCDCCSDGYYCVADPIKPYDRSYITPFKLRKKNCQQCNLWLKMIFHTSGQFLCERCMLEHFQKYPNMLKTANLIKPKCYKYKLRNDEHNITL